MKKLFRVKEVANYLAVIFTFQVSYDRKEVIANKSSEQTTVASKFFCKFKISYRFNSLRVGSLQLLLILNFKFLQYLYVLL